MKKLYNSLFETNQEAAINEDTQPTPTNGISQNKYRYPVRAGAWFCQCCPVPDESNDFQEPLDIQNAHIHSTEEIEDNGHDGNGMDETDTHLPVSEDQVEQQNQISSAVDQGHDGNGTDETDQGSKSATGKKLNVTVVSDVSNWNNNVNQQLLVELAKDPRLKVTGFVPGHTEEQSKYARNLNIELVDADDLHGFSETELLSYPPDSLQIDILLIHSYGPGLGKHAQVIRKNKKCKWAQVVHMVNEELQTFSENAENCKHDHKMKIALCEKADVIIAIGPKVADAYRRALRVSRNDEKVIELTPGVIKELSGIRREYEDNGKFCVLVSVSSHFFKVKGCDIAASAIKLLDMSYHLIVVVRSGESSEKEAEIKQALLNQGIDKRQLTVRVCESHLDWHRWLCEVDLVIKPSRTEGYGMSGVLAISANLPVLVSSYCGLGEVLKHLPTGANCVVESDDAQVWADKIKEIRENSPRNRRLQAEGVKEEYTNNFNWGEQCEELVKKFFTMTQCKDDDTGENAQCMGSHGSVDSIRRNVESIGLVDKGSISQTQNGKSCDVV